MELNNRKALHDYFIESRYNAGIVLTGTEIKSLRTGKVSFNDSYCFFHQNELFVKSLHIAPYKYGTDANHDPMQDRKLLLTKRELRKLELKIKEKGYSIIPLRIFINENGLAKMEIGLAKGKKNYDKRETIKNREHEREMNRKFNNG